MSKKLSSSRVWLGLIAVFFMVGLLSISCDQEGSKGTEGLAGAAGSSCTVTENDDGTKTITCEDGTSATIEAGAAGVAGSSCTVTDNDDGTKTISCEDGTSVTVLDGTSTGTIFGVLKNEGGVALEGATVVTVPETISVETQADGTYELKDIPIGVYVIEVSLEGYETSENEDVSVIAGGTASVNVTLDEAIEPEFSVARVVGISGPRGDTDVYGLTTNSCTSNSDCSAGEQCDTTSGYCGKVHISLTGYADHNNEKIITSGLRNVGVGMYVYLEGKDEDPGENALSNWTWELIKPENSSAALSFWDGASTTTRVWGSTQTQFARFVADIGGEYYVKTTAQNNESTPKTFEGIITIYAGTYVGADDCAICHNNAAVVGPYKAVYGEWVKTGHASKFELSFGRYKAGGSYCIPCHTTGYNEQADDDGFDDMALLAGWDPVADGDMGGWLTTNYKKDYDKFLEDPKTVSMEALGGVQCEACHGPGSNHPEAVAHISFEDGVCKQCHPQSAQWEESAHSNYPSEHLAGSHCAQCHTGQGFVVNQDHGEEIIYPHEANEGEKPNMVPIADQGAISCAACHDPHKFTDPFESGSWKSKQLRFHGDVTAPMGFTVEAAESAVCVKCHANKRDTQYYADFMAGKKSRGPHRNTQSDVFAGKGGHDYGESIGSSRHTSVVTESCIECHMYTGGSEAACTSDSDCAGYETCSKSKCKDHAVGGHTWAMTWDAGTPADASDDIDHVSTCMVSDCHSSGTFTDSFNDYAASGDFDGDGTTEGAQDEIQGLLNALAAVLPQNSDGTVLGKGFNKKTEDERKALWNYWMVKYDGSLGIHNTRYAAGLLRVTYEKFTGTALAGDNP